MSSAEFPPHLIALASKRAINSNRRPSILAVDFDDVTTADP
jgi:hypothetical protein